jgi:hypothetical protein
MKQYTQLEVKSSRKAIKQDHHSQMAPPSTMMMPPPTIMTQPIMYQQPVISQQQMIQQQIVRQHQPPMIPQMSTQPPMIQQPQLQPPQRINCLFYVQQCGDCIKFVKAMYENQFINNFKLIPLDSPQYAHLANRNIVHPTLIVATLPKPFEGTQAVYQWLETARTFKMNQIASLNATAVRLNLMKMAGPMGFNDKEMGCGSDPYTFVKIDNPLAQSYYFHGTEQPIMTAPEEDKLGKKEIDTKITSLTNTRKKEDDTLQKANELYHEKILNTAKGKK